MIKIVVFDDDKCKNSPNGIGSFFIPDNAAKEWVEKNIPFLIQAIRLMSWKIDETGY